MWLCATRPLASRGPVQARCRHARDLVCGAACGAVRECCVWCGVVHVRPHKRTLNHASATCIARSGLDPACLPRRLSRRRLAAAPAAPPRSSRHCFSLGVSWLGRDRQLCMVAYGSRHSWAGARATCSALGGRLCSPHELRSQPEGGGVRGSGAASRCARQGQWVLSVDFRAALLTANAELARPHTPLTSGQIGQLVEGLPLDEQSRINYNEFMAAFEAVDTSHYERTTTA